ncbi:MAG: hypothetical protein HY216_17330, partial [Candidatus Rokubacteria bacterium]|nr:hypothetical protein [Candidatus Rokubacteria bacterium]
MAAPAPRLRQADLAVAGLAGVLLLLFAVFVAWPVLRVLTLGGAADYRAFFGTWRLLRILVNSLLVAAASTLITVTLAVVLAYAVTRTTVPGKRFLS